MAEQAYHVIFTYKVWEDIERIVSYWTERNEAERGVRYAHDLPAEARRLLSDPRTARSGKYLRNTAYPDVQELRVFERSYRILYRVKASAGLVEVLRFWHSRRQEPFQD